MTRRERLEQKRAKREAWANARRAKAHSLLAQDAHYHGDIAFNTQPGHVPERARVIARHDQAMDHLSMADDHTAKADGLACHLERSIFSDDDNAIKALEIRIAEHEAKRDRMKLVNRLYKKGDVSGLAGLGIDASALQANLATAGPYWGDQPHLPYELTNLGARIRADRKRVEEIKTRQSRMTQA